MTSSHTLRFQEEDPTSVRYSTSDPTSFAFVNARDRWPKVLNGAIERIESTIKSNARLPPLDLNAARVIQAQISTLKGRMDGNAVLQPLEEDGGTGIQDYNEELGTLEDPTWHNGPWLYTACYMYRLLHSFFAMSTPFWQSFDVFATTKRRAVEASKKGVMELVKRHNAIQGQDPMNEAAQNALFEEMVQISLWGNATDLGLLTSLTVDELDSRQGRHARENSKEKVLVDDTGQAWTLLNRLKSSPETTTIHFVLDNAGFELLADLVFISYLLANRFTDTVVLHGKSIPWFVSDVTRTDLDDLVSGCAEGTICSNLSIADIDELQKAGEHWRGLMEQGLLSFAAHPFWTTQHPMGRMAVVTSELYRELASADLVICKGDLNYRKLTYDAMWPRTTPFSKAIGPLATKQLDGKGMRILALRTAKADVAVGLPEGLEATLPADWTRTGKYAMIQYYDGKLAKESDDKS